MKHISQNNRIGADKPNDRHYNKRCFSANGFSLLPLALKQRLFSLFNLSDSSSLLLAVIGLIGLVFNLFIFSNPTFAINPCTGSATCLNVSIANSISLDLKPVSSSGTFASSSTTDNTISVTTNYFSGYKLSIAASTANDNTLKYEENNVVLATIPSHNIAAGISANNYADDTYASTNHLNNTWGYRPSKLNSTDNTNYLPGPTSITDTTLDSTTTANPETANNYNIAIGARVDMTTPKGLYANTFVIKVVANPIPYTIAYNKNTEDTVTNMPANVNTTTMDTSVTVGNAPSRSGYNFVGWCTGIVADGNTCDNPYTPYAAGGNYTIDHVNGGNNLILYAVWAEIPKITFKAGNNIETVIVAGGSNKFKPFYATASSDVVFNNAVPGTKYIVTVVPTANHTLDSTTPWTRKNSAGQDATVGNLASNTLLTTTYIVGNGSETLTANGSQNTGNYTAMKDLNLASCPAYNDIQTPGGINVTDERDGKSYTVAKFGNYCYMLSNLRLEGGTALDATTSAVSANTFTLPSQTTWTSSAQDHYCEARMRYIGNEYYYNWYAAKANPTTGVTSSLSCATEARDNASLGSICPANWVLPTYNDITAATLWNDGANPGLLAASGYFYSGAQRYFGDYGRWWSSARNTNYYAYYLFLNGISVRAGRNGDIGDKCYGFSVRCMRSN